MNVRRASITISIELNGEEAEDLMSLLHCALETKGCIGHSKSMQMLAATLHDNVANSAGSPRPRKGATK